MADRADDIGSPPAAPPEREYPFTLSPLSAADGGGWLIEFPDLPDCIADGETPEAAIAAGREAKTAWITAMDEAGRTVPDPGAAPPANHADLISYLGRLRNVREWVRDTPASMGKALKALDDADHQAIVLTMRWEVLEWSERHERQTVLTAVRPHTAKARKGVGDLKAGLAGIEATRPGFDALGLPLQPEAARALRQLQVALEKHAWVVAATNERGRPPAAWAAHARRIGAALAARLKRHGLTAHAANTKSPFCQAVAEITAAITGLKITEQANDGSITLAGVRDALRARGDRPE